MSTNNAIIRKTAKEKGICLWEVANALCISEATMTRMLRKELPEAETSKMLNFIEKLAEQKENASR